MKFPVFDLHCDSAYALLGEDFNSAGSLHKNQLHMDLERAKELGGYAQCLACFTSPLMEQWCGTSAINMFERQLASIQREVDKNKRLIAIAYGPGDVQTNLEKGKMSAILTLEGSAGFGYDPELLQDLSLIGFRMTSLTWNESNPLAGSHLTGGGLTDQGKAFVCEAQRLGMLVDVSHISDEAFWDIMDITEKPVIASHSNSRSVHPVSRNLTDEMFCAICKTDGVVGINLYSEFLGVPADLDRVCDHIFHFMELDPTGRHIALGGDLDGCDSLPNGFAGVQSYPALAQCLTARGLSADTVYQIFWKNALGVIARCCT